MYIEKSKKVMDGGSLVGKDSGSRPEGPGSRLIIDECPPCTLFVPRACKKTFLGAMSSKLSKVDTAEW